MERWRSVRDRVVAVTRRVTERLWAVARDPLRVLPVVAVIALLAIAVPLTVTGLTRVGRSAMDWRHRSAIAWHHASATVERAKIDDGLVLDLACRSATTPATIRTWSSWASATPTRFLPSSSPARPSAPALPASCSRSRCSGAVRWWR